MLRKTDIKWRLFPFHPTRQDAALSGLPAKSVFPLLHYNNLLPRMYKFDKDYMGRRGFNEEDHPLPVVGSRSSEYSKAPKWSEFDKYVNPQVLSSWSHLSPTEQYAGKRNGYLYPGVGWRRPGGSWKFAKNFNRLRRGYMIGMWQEKAIIPLWKQVPRVTAIGPRARYEGKLEYSTLNLSKLLWSIDAGLINPNETITLYTLVQARVVPEVDVCWPGLCLEAGDLGDRKLPYPINVEVQKATPKAIELIEEAGGNVVCTYLSAEGIYHEMRPEEYPVFPEQEMPDRLSYEAVMSRSKSRGFLSNWYEEEGKYAHPESGRRLSHYVAPPFARDFPATFEEYERVKHHQKWHLGQPGTGTVLPFTPTNAAEHVRPAVGPPG